MGCGVIRYQLNQKVTQMMTSIIYQVLAFFDKPETNWYTIETLPRKNWGTRNLDLAEGLESRFVGFMMEKLTNYVPFLGPKLPEN